jgi:hypothetical protein
MIPPRSWISRGDKAVDKALISVDNPEEAGDILPGLEDEKQRHQEESRSEDCGSPEKVGQYPP